MCDVCAAEVIYCLGNIRASTEIAAVTESFNLGRRRRGGGRQNTEDKAVCGVMNVHASILTSRKIQANAALHHSVSACVCVYWGVSVMC